MKKILLYIVSTLILAACSDEIPEHHQPVRAKRAVLAYMVANNNLDGLIMQNIRWMYESLSTAKDTCTLVVYYKPSESNQYMKTAEILEFTTDGYGRINGQTILSGSSLTSENVISQAVHHQASIGIATDPFIMAENLRMMQET